MTVTSIEPRRPGLWRRLLRWLVRLVLAGLVLLALLIAAYAWLPAPSTLMLGRWLTGRPVERLWVGLADISPHLIRAVIASEDQRFCAHSGIDWVELDTVLSDEDGPSRGASTITMQVAKNLFLWPGRSVLRKGLELPLALALDAVWSKRRIMEVYLNLAEWGEGVFGAEAAARRAFGKEAAGLTRPEAARLAAALPNPLKRDAAKPDRALQAAARAVQQKMGQAAGLAACALPAVEEDLE